TRRRRTAARTGGSPPFRRYGAERRSSRASPRGRDRAAAESRQIPSHPANRRGSDDSEPDHARAPPLSRGTGHVVSCFERLLLVPREVVDGHAGDPGELTADGDTTEVGADRLDAERGVDGGRPRLERAGGLIERRQLRPGSGARATGAEEVVAGDRPAGGAVVTACVHDTVGDTDADDVAVEAGLPVQRTVLHVQAEGGAAVARARREQGVPVLRHLDHLERAVREARRRDERRRAAVGERQERAVRRVDGADADAAVTAGTDRALLEAALDDPGLAGVGR